MLSANTAPAVHRSKEYGNVAVLMGGRSPEREISLKSGQLILEALGRSGINAHAFDPAHTPLSQLQTEKTQCAFIALHGGAGEDGSLQGALEYLGIPYTGSGVGACAMSADKWRSKLLWQALGIPTPLCEVMHENSDPAAMVDRLGLPLFIKPSTGGSGLGISKVTQESNIPSAYLAARAFSQGVIAEQAICGSEYTAALLNGRVLPLVGIEVATTFYDFDAKYTRNDTVCHCPAAVTDSQRVSLTALLQKAYAALGCKGWARIDFLLDDTHAPYLLEVNTVPGMTDHSLFPMAAKQAGLSYDALVLEILNTAR